MREPVFYGAVRILPRPQAVEPVGHVLERAVVDAHGRQSGFSGEQQVFRLALLIYVGVLLVGSFFFNQFISRAALAANVDQRRLLSHVTGEAGSVVSKAGRVTDEKSFGIFEQRVK